MVRHGTGALGPGGLHHESLYAEHQLTDEQIATAPLKDLNVKKIVSRLVAIAGGSSFSAIDWMCDMVGFVHFIRLVSVVWLTESEVLLEVGGLL